MRDKSICHINGYQIKDAIARNLIDEIKTSFNALAERLVALEEMSEFNDLSTIQNELENMSNRFTDFDNALTAMEDKKVNRLNKSSGIYAYAINNGTDASFQATYAAPYVNTIPIRSSNGEILAQPGTSANACVVKSELKPKCIRLEGGSTYTIPSNTFGVYIVTSIKPVTIMDAKVRNCTLIISDMGGTSWLTMLGEFYDPETVDLKEIDSETIALSGSITISNTETTSAIINKVI